MPLSVQMNHVFCTGGAGERTRSSIGQVNAQAVWGLAAALRYEGRDAGVKIGEVRLGLRFNRRYEERRADPRPSPLSRDVGTICAGIAAADHHQVGLHLLDTNDDVQRLKHRYPVVIQPYGMFYRPYFAAEGGFL